MSWMEFIIAMTAIILGGMIFVIPVLSIALRRSLQPLLETWAKTKDVHLIERVELREVALEERITRIEKVLDRVVEEKGVPPGAVGPLARELTRRPSAIVSILPMGYTTKGVFP